MSLKIADDAYVLDDGIVVYSGSAQELAADEAPVRALAGASAEEWTLTWGGEDCFRLARNESATIIRHETAGQHMLPWCSNWAADYAFRLHSLSYGVRRRPIRPTSSSYGDLGSGNQVYLLANLTAHAEKVAFLQVTYDFLDVDWQLICRVMLDPTERWIRHPVAAVAKAVGEISFAVRRNALKSRACCDR
jgi:hypothetical protein